MSNQIKAVRITKDNKKVLEGQYNMSDNFLEYSSGLYLVAEFGDQQYKAILTKSGLEARYNRVNNLANGFFEVEKKVA